MPFGISDTGFNIKRQTTILEEMRASVESEFGENYTQDASDKVNQLLGIFSAGQAELWQLGQDVYNSYYPQTSNGVTLDNVSSITGTFREAPRRSTARVFFAGDPNTTIPRGFVGRVQNTINDFSLDDEITLISAVNESQRISFRNPIPVNSTGTFTIRFLEQTATFNLGETGNNTDIDAWFQSNFSTEVQGTFTIVAQFDWSTGITIEFQGALGGRFLDLLDVSSVTLTDGTVINTTIQRLSRGHPNGQFGIMSSVNFGPIQAPANSITVIRNPIVGLNSITNEINAIPGRLLETDAEIRVRRLSELQQTNLSSLPSISRTLMDLTGVTSVSSFENDTGVTDSENLPPHSYEFVVNGGDNNSIARVILDNKPIGINNHGMVRVNLNDSEGISRPVFFSRPSQVLFEVRIVFTAQESMRDRVFFERSKVLTYFNEKNLGDSFYISEAIIDLLDGVIGVLSYDSVQSGIRTLGTSGAFENFVQLNRRQLGVLEDSNLTITANYA